jgi:membrane protein DedA with SNARE-associated domain
MLEPASTVTLGFIGTIAGDVSLYWIGRLAGNRLEKRFGQTGTWLSARNQFNRRGALTVYLTRWLLSEVAMPVTLIAGSSRFPFSKFLVIDMLGELTWFAAYGGLGYAFGSQWELISEFISNFSGFIFGAVVLGLGIYALIHFSKHPKKAANAEVATSI